MQKLLRDVEGGKLLTRFIAREQRPKLLEVEAEIRRLADVVDRFYALLGGRNWIYHDDLPVSSIERIVDLAVDDAERELIDLYRSPNSLRPMVRRLSRFPELQARMGLLEHAETDFHSGRHYATIHLLLSVMDGFVNDLDPGERRGLHAREADELDAWDSVVGHHLGLAHAHASFNRTFRKRSDESITELFRNGIVHGMLTNYGNDVVAAKAWNRLFAVADWATSRVREATPAEPTKGWGEILQTLQRTAEARRALDSWQSFTLSSDDPDFERDEAILATRTYLDAWCRENYGAMAAVLSPLVAEPTLARTAGMVRESMSEDRLSEYRLDRVEHRAAAVAVVEGVLNFKGEQVPVRIRLIRAGPDGLGVAPNEQGSWRLMTWTYFGMRAEAAD